MKKNLCSFTDFIKLDIRVGEVITVSEVKDSNKLLEITIDLGTDYGKVTILSGIAKFVKKEDLVGKKLPIVANLEPKQMAGKTSSGFILMADLENHIPSIIFLPESLPAGTILC